MPKKAILFDLDGTLLPLDNDEFANTYVGLLAKKSATWGYNPEEMVKALWKGTGAMIKNDGSQSNYDIFWQVFASLVTAKGKEEIYTDIARFDEFYHNEFNLAKSVTPGNSLAKPLIDGLKGKYTLILATNPIFPRVAIESRLGWIGLDINDFSYVTTYENSSFCKPNPKYYQEILDKNGLSAADCLFIGNDMEEDIVPGIAVGLDTMLVTDCLRNEHNRPFEGKWQGKFADLAKAIENI